MDQEDTDKFMEALGDRAEDGDSTKRQAANSMLILIQDRRNAEMVAEVVTNLQGIRKKVVPILAIVEANIDERHTHNGSKG